MNEPRQNGYRNLIDAAEQILGWAFEGGPPLSDGEWSRVTAAACSDLRRLSSDSDLRSVLARVEELSRKRSAELQELAVDTALFERSFLTPERQILEAAGLSPGAAGTILSLAARHQSVVAGPFDAERAQQELHDLRDRICDVQEQQPTRELAQRLAGILMLGLDIEFSKRRPADWMSWSLSILLGFAMASDPAPPFGVVR